jgi:hypothetical protein
VNLVYLFHFVLVTVHTLAVIVDRHMAQLVASTEYIHLPFAAVVFCFGYMLLVIRHQLYGSYSPVHTLAVFLDRHTAHSGSV